MSATAAPDKATRAARAPQEQPLPPPQPVTIKGDRRGLRILVRSRDAEAVLATMRDELASKAQFFQGAQVRLEFETPPMDLELAALLATELSRAGIHLASVSLHEGAASRDKRAARAPDQTRPDESQVVRQNAVVPASAALFVAGTVRGGQRIVHGGPVVVYGDVNPGAEIVAGGSVVVWGQLRGTVEAGMGEGGPAAVVCALNLAPTQLRIGGVVARAPEESEREPEPEVASREGEKIVVNAWR